MRGPLGVEGRGKEGDEFAMRNPRRLDKRKKIEQSKALYRNTKQ